MEAHIGQHISQATEIQTLCWSKTRPSFSGAHNSYFSWSITTIFVPRIDMYNRINNPKTDLIFLKIWCKCHILSEGTFFFTHPVYILIWHIKTVLILTVLILTVLMLTVLMLTLLMLTLLMLTVLMLTVLMLTVLMLTVLMLTVLMLTVLMLTVLMLTVLINIRYWLPKQCAQNRHKREYFNSYSTLYAHSLLINLVYICIVITDTLFWPIDKPRY